MAVTPPPPIDDTQDPNEDARQDGILMQRVATGDAGAFRELVEKHQNRVIGTIAKMLGDGRDAEDLAQYVFLRVWNSAARYEPRAKFTTWLYTITRNLVFNEIRRRERSRSDSLDARIENTGDVFVDPSTVRADEAVLREELEAAIQSAMDALSPTQRMAIVLRRYEDLSYEEIAVVMELTVSSVKSLLFRARNELKERLAPYLDG
jgi:RNA polymerase sigma-70 factor (ECF subfamily)